MDCERDDVHSQLNRTRLAEVARPTTLDEPRRVIRARVERPDVSIAGGCHAMGGQQFGRAPSTSTRPDYRVLEADAERGLLTIEAGATGRDHGSQPCDAASGVAWGIRQKQTGVDAVTLGGSISANAHGRGLLMQPLVDDVET